MLKEKLSSPEFNTVLNLFASNVAREVKRKLFDTISITFNPFAKVFTMHLPAALKVASAML